MSKATTKKNKVEAPVATEEAVIELESSQDAIIERVNDVIATLRAEQSVFENCAHPVARSVAAALHGACYGLKRDLGNKHGISVNIDG